MAQPRGRWISLSPVRRFIGDLVHFARSIPLCTAERRMDLAEVARIRRLAQPSPGWCTLFLRAYSLVAKARPELRRAYLPYPWDHCYEHPESVASVAIERDLGTENGVFFGHVRGPENQSLAGIEKHLHRLKNDPVSSIPLFRRILQVARYPRFVRHLLWWYSLNVSGYDRARHLGTFGISVIAGLGASSVHLLTPLTSALNYGVLGADGSMVVRLTYDHRVLDGGSAARALAELEGALQSQIRSELEGMTEATTPTRAAG